MGGLVSDDGRELRALALTSDEHNPPREVRQLVRDELRLWWAKRVLQELHLAGHLETLLADERVRHDVTRQESRVCKEGSLGEDSRSG